MPPTLSLRSFFTRHKSRLAARRDVCCLEYGLPPLFFFTLLHCFRQGELRCPFPNWLGLSLCKASHPIRALCLIRYKTEDTNVFFWHQEAFSPACIWATDSRWNLCPQMLKSAWITKICLSPRIFWWMPLLCLSFLAKIFYSLRNSKKKKMLKNSEAAEVVYVELTCVRSTCHFLSWLCAWFMQRDATSRRALNPRSISTSGGLSWDQNTIFKFAANTALRDVKRAVCCVTGFFWSNSLLSHLCTPGDTFPLFHVHFTNARGLNEGWTGEADICILYPKGQTWDIFWQSDTRGSGTVHPLHLWM